MTGILFSPPDIQAQDIEAVTAVLKSGWLTTGPQTKAFEKDIATYCGTKNSVCLGSATAAMELTLRVLGIGPGDEVITSAYTYTASASVICHVGAVPVLVDTAPGSYHIDISQLEKVITPKTKAIIAVDIGGVMCDYDKMLEVVRGVKNKFLANSKLQHRLGRVAIVADAAHSMGASYRGVKSGMAADFSIFSFHAVKNLTTGEGGAVTWKSHVSIDDEDLYKQFMLLSLHGQNKDALAKTKSGTWEYDILIPGYKCNMTDIMAALGISQLKRYDEILAKREGLFSLYQQLLKDVGVELLKHRQEDSVSSFHICMVSLKNKDEIQRNQIIEQMAQKGIATNVHFKPLPMHSAYKKMGFDIGQYPQAYEMYKKEITLPLHTLLKEEQIVYITETLKSLL
jgi:dTDP-4-amino-4,6-dideoxygalactose transaminase